LLTFSFIMGHILQALYLLSEKLVFILYLLFWEGRANEVDAMMLRRLENHSTGSYLWILQSYNPPPQKGNSELTGWVHDSNFSFSTAYSVILTTRKKQGHHLPRQYV
jgi:hypothetical protein